MLRQIYIITATQVVASESNPQGVYSNVTNYPKTFDSRDYEATDENPNGNPELALTVAQADFAEAVKQLSLAHNREAWAVTITRAADGQIIQRKSFGAFPDMTPAPQPEPEEQSEESGEEPKTPEWI